MYRHISVRAGGTVISSPCEISLNSQAAIRTFEATRIAVHATAPNRFYFEQLEGNRMTVWMTRALQYRLPLGQLLSRNAGASSSQALREVSTRLSRIAILHSLSVIGLANLFSGIRGTLEAIQGFVQWFRTEGRGSVNDQMFQTIVSSWSHRRRGGYSSTFQHSRIAPNRHTNTPALSSRRDSHERGTIWRMKRVHGAK